MTRRTSVAGEPAVGTMTGEDELADVATRSDRRGPTPSPARLVALAGGLVLLASGVTVLHRVADVVGVSRPFVVLVALSLLGATVLGRVVAVRTAVVLGAGLAVAGAYRYLDAVPADAAVDPSIRSVVADAIVLLGGRSILQVVAVDVWVLAAVPAPTFLAWLFAVRERYVSSLFVGVGTLGALVLTGDAGYGTALVGTLAGIAMVGFGELEERGAGRDHAEALVLLLCVIAATSLAVGSLPLAGLAGTGGAGGPAGPGGGPTTLEVATVGADEEVRVVGSITLSPTVTMTVESEEPARWRVDAYDRYTGDGWVRTGSDGDPIGSIPSGGADGAWAVDRNRLRQAVTVEDRLAGMPAAWRPVAVAGAPVETVLRSQEGGLRPSGELAAGDRYVVTSERPPDDPSRLERADGPIPSAIERRYTQVPDGTPDRVAAYAAEIVADADSTHGAARAVEQHLRSSKAYSLSVDRPAGDVADGFLFGMEAGYCVYYATTMAVMLRTQGIPTRFVTGYATGEPVGEDRWVVRGLDAHAWVEVYLPGVGWVPFDPTPPADRRAVHEDRLQLARAAGEPDVDTPASAVAAANATGEEGEFTDANASSVDADAVDEGEPGVENRSTPATGDDGPGGGPVGDGTRLVDRLWALASGLTWHSIGLAIAGLGGALLGARRLDVVTRLRSVIRTIDVGSRPSEPGERIDRAYRRLERRLSTAHRGRRPGETRRDYVVSGIDAGIVDPRAVDVVEAYERWRYDAGDGPDRESADRVEASLEVVLGA